MKNRKVSSTAPIATKLTIASIICIFMRLFRFSKHRHRDSVQCNSGTSILCLSLSVLFLRQWTGCGGGGGVGEVDCCRCGGGGGGGKFYDNDVDDDEVVEPSRLLQFTLEFQQQQQQQNTIDKINRKKAYCVCVDLFQLIHSLT